MVIETKAAMISGLMAIKVRTSKSLSETFANIPRIIISLLLFAI